MRVPDKAKEWASSILKSVETIAKDPIGTLRDWFWGKVLDAWEARRSEGVHRARQETVPPPKLGLVDDIAPTEFPGQDFSHLAHLFSADDLPDVLVVAYTNNSISLRGETPWVRFAGREYELHQAGDVFFFQGAGGKIYVFDPYEGDYERHGERQSPWEQFGKTYDTSPYPRKKVQS